MKTFRPMVPSVLAVFLLLVASPVRAGEFDGWATDEAEFSQPLSERSRSVPLSLRPDETKSESIEGGIEWTVLREVNGALEPMSGIPVDIGGVDTGRQSTDESGTVRLAECAPRSTWRVRGDLTRQRFSVTDGDSAYRLEAQLDCGTRVTWIFRADSNGGQALGIWRIARMAERKLGSTVGLGFWNRSIGFVWPGGGDYYSFGTVNITRGDQWDVVGHELGHAIYDLADIGAFGGGQHKIDECYSEALALSEGWASYFSGWLSVPLDDPDARFEFMVPRRAPIRFENIPADVCSSPRNEWRVTGFFWDLIDRNEDGETSIEPFERAWRALAGTKSSGLSAARSRLEQAGFDRSTVNLLWTLNFPSN